MNVAQLARRLLAAALTAGAWVACLEAAGLALRHHVHGLALGWLAAATFGLSGVALALAAAAWLGLATRSRPAAWLAALEGRLAQRPRVRVAAAAALLAGSLALHVVNTTLYVRLYAGLHGLLSVATLLCSLAGFALLVRGAPRPSWLVDLAAALGLTVTLLASLVQVTVDVVLRSHALEQGTLLAHELLALDRLTGILAATELKADGKLDPEVRAALEPRAVAAPSGLARGAHVVLVTIDSLRADRWQAGGAVRPELHALEQLGREGVRFSRAYAPSCWTIHSMSSVLYGQLPSQLRFTPVGVSADYDFIAFSAQAARNPLNFKKMTPVPFEAQGPGLVAALRAAGHETATVAPYVFYFRRAGLTADFEHVDEAAYRALGFGHSGIAPVPLVERAERFLDARDTSRPFFLWLHFMEPHAPYEAQDEAARGKGAEPRYDSELRRVDAQLAQLREALVRRGLDARTLWIVHADHGEEFGDHGGAFHASTLYEEIVRVPLLIRLPSGAAPPPRVIDRPVSLLDLAPTLLDLLGVESDTKLMGRSLRGALVGEEPPPRPVLMECDRFAAQKRAYLRWPFKLIADRATGTLQLYALASDPHERDNLAGREPAILQLMAAELEQLAPLLQEGRRSALSSPPR